MLAARKCIIILMLYIVTSCVVQITLDWPSYSANLVQAKNLIKNSIVSKMCSHWVTMVS